MRNACLGVGRFGVVLWALLATAQPRYDLLLKGGHVIDPANDIKAVRDIAIAAGRITAVAENIPAASAIKTVDVSEFYITPDLVDIHSHVMTMSGLRG